MVNWCLRNEFQVRKKTEPLEASRFISTSHDSHEKYLIPDTRARIRTFVQQCFLGMMHDFRPSSSSDTITDYQFSFRWNAKSEGIVGFSITARRVAAQ